MIEGVDTVMHRRNVTVNTGCFCMPIIMQRVQQIESNIGHAQVHIRNIGPWIELKRFLQALGLYEGHM